MDDAAVLKRRGYILGINLGEGSYAKVKSAYSERLKFNVAVKIIDRKRAPTDFLEKFLPREIEILIMLNHRSIVKTYEIFETSEGKVYIIMELGVQGDLLDFIKSRGALREDDARKKFHQLSLAIKYCHDLDIVHRDLKCENLLLDKDFNIKLSDFGFSKRCLRDESGLLILSKTFCGSAAYAAPEVLQGIPYQPKVYDIWSLGVILYIMVCGSMPYDDSNIKKMLRIQKEHRINFPRSKHLTNECKDLIYRMLQPDVNRRLHIEEILSHAWVQPKPRGLSKEGAGLLGTEPPQVPEPSRTPEASMTTQHSRTPEPSQTTGHSRTPEPSQTTGHSRTPEPSQTTGHSRTPEASQTTGHSRTPEASQTTGHSRTPEASQTTGHSRTPEASQTTESSSDKKSVSHQEPQEEAQPEVTPESKPQEEMVQGQVSRQLESTSLIAPTGQRSRETVEGRSPKPPQTQ